MIAVEGTKSIRPQQVWWLGSSDVVRRQIWLVYMTVNVLMRVLDVAFGHPRGVVGQIGGA
jgi:hypothetical protein